MPSSRRTTRRAGLLVLTGALVAAALLLPAGAQTADVSALDNRFDPFLLTVDAGATVRWRNEGRAVHSVTTQAGQPVSFDSTSPPGTCSPVVSVGCLQPGATYSRTFPAREDAYTVRYYCRVHGLSSGDPAEGKCGMCGAILVRAAPRSSPIPTQSFARRTQPPVTSTSRPLPGASGTASPTGGASPAPTTTEDPLAAGDGGAPTGRILLSLAAIAGLAVAGRAIWRRMIAPPDAGRD